MKVTKRGNSWQYDLFFENKRYRKGSFTTKREATLAGNELLNNLTKGINPYNKIAFSQYLKEWKEIYIKDYVGAKTYNNYDRYCSKVEKYFKEKPINKVTRNEYQLFITSFKNSLSQDQLGRLNQFIKKAVSTAIFDGLLTKDFTFNVKIESSKPPIKKETDKYFNIDELKQIKTYYLNKTRYYSASTHLILLMIETGGRFSDCINLTRKDINEANSTIFLNGTKNKSAARTVTVSKSLIKLLINYIDNHTTSIEGYVFVNKGKQITNSTVNKSIREACSQLSIDRNITSHAFRHTHASLLIHEGLNIYYISKRLGHSSIDITLKDYGHLLKETYEKDNKKALKIINEL
ncbi:MULTISPECIES: tyrosine-type recombinase/integrase [Staphylococcus]|nr:MULTISPECIES: tyrosine-type recombinase/integrase [Staphylococcus]MCE4992093.1 site-specific integrase [Staphylococcus haemolyticus]